MSVCVYILASFTRHAKCILPRNMFVCAVFFHIISYMTRFSVKKKYIDDKIYVLISSTNFV